jgi:hypothetical protein
MWGHSLTTNREKKSFWNLMKALWEENKDIHWIIRADRNFIPSLEDSEVLGVPKR